MFSIYLIILAISTVVFTLLPLIFGKGRKKTVNLIFLCLCIACFIVTNVIRNIDKKDSSNYKVYGGGLFREVEYLETKGGYHIFKEDTLRVKELGHDIAVPDSIELPWYTEKIDRYNTRILCTKDTEIDKNKTIKIDGETYILADNAEKIKTSYTYFMAPLPALYLSFLLFNILSSKKKKNK